VASRCFRKRVRKALTDKGMFFDLVVRKTREIADTRQLTVGREKSLWVSSRVNTQRVRR